MVQMRWGHLNRDYSLLTKVQSLFLDGHLLLEQTARSRSGRFFNFNGTAGIWRKSCISDAGGWQHDTLTEDMDLSYRAQMKGWQFIYLPDVVVPAELPVDINGFKSQQHRWTKGSIQTCKKLLPEIWRSRLPLLIKLEATVHLTSNFGYLLLVLLCVLILPQSYSTHGAMYAWLVDLPIFFATSVSIALFYIVAQTHLNPRGWVRELWMFPLTLALATGMSVNNARGVIEAILNHRSEFSRTPKYGMETDRSPVRRVRYVPLKSWLPLIELMFALYFAFCTWNAATDGTLALGALPHDLPGRFRLRRREIRFILDSTDRRPESVAFRGVSGSSDHRSASAAAVLAGCATDTRHVLLISTRISEMLVLRDNIKIAQYPVSTSKFGVGDAPKSNATPIGLLENPKKNRHPRSVRRGVQIAAPHGRNPARGRAGT